MAIKRRRDELRVAEAAKLLRVSKSTIQRMVDTYLAVQAGQLPADTPGQLPGRKIPTGRLFERRVDRAAAEALARQRTTGQGRDSA